MAEAATADPFANGANPFKGPKTPFVEPADPFANGANPFKGPRPVQAPQQSGLDYADIVKSGAIGVAKGAIDATLGLPGNIEALSDAIGSAPRRLAEFMELIPTSQPNPQIKSYLPTLPIGADIQHSIEKVTGPFYEPQSEAGKYAEKIGEFAPIALGMPAESLLARVGNVGRYAVAPAIGAQVGHEVGGPVGEVIGTVAGGGLPLAATATKEAAIAGYNRLAPNLPGRIGQDAAELQVGREMTGAVAKAGEDPGQVRKTLEAYQPGVPGARLTTGQASDSLGLLGLEKGVAQTHREDFIAQSAENNLRRLEAIRALKPNAAPADVATGFRAMREALDAETQAALENATARAETARNAASPTAQSAEQTGEALRASASAAAAAAKAESERLYGLVDPDKNLVIPGAPISGTVGKIRSETSEAEKELGIPSNEKAIFDLAAKYGDATKLNEVRDVRSRILTEMSNIRQQNPQSYRRLNQLVSAIDDAIDHAVENKAALDQIAVSRGTLAPEQSLQARWQAEADRFVAERRVALGTGRASPGPVPGQREAGVPPLSGAAGEGAGRSGHAEGSAGLSGGAGSQGASPGPAYVAGADAAALKAANDHYREMKQVYGEGPLGDILQKQARGAGYDLPDSSVPANIWKSGPTGGETARAYLRASGQEGIDALSDHAALDLYQKAVRPDGSLDPKKVDAWMSDRQYGPALRELPAQARVKFSSAADAQRAAEQAFADRRDALTAFERSEAGKVAKLGEEGDIVRHVGSLLGARDGASRLGQLMDAAKGNDAAEEGLRRAVIDYVENRFKSSAEAGVSGEKQIKRADFINFIKDNTDKLEKVLRPEQVGMLRAINDELLKEGRSLQKFGVGSDTTQNLAAAAKVDGNKSILANLNRQLDMKEAFSLAAGAHFGGPVGAGLGWMGAKVAKGFHEAGLARRDEIMTRAVLDPKFGAALLAKADARPDRDAFALLGLRARQMSLALGAAASRTTSGDNNQ